MAKSRTKTKIRYRTRAASIGRRIGRRSRSGVKGFFKGQTVEMGLKGIGAAVIARQVIGPVLGNDPKANLVIGGISGYLAGGTVGAGAAIAAPFVLPQISNAIGGIAGRVGGAGGINPGALGGL